MKMKEFGPRKGHTSLAPPWIRLWQWHIQDFPEYANLLLVDFLL